MALPPKLKALRMKLEGMTYSQRTTGQDAMLAELQELDNVMVRKGVQDSEFSATQMTSPGGNTCGCCGR